MMHQVHPVRMYLTIFAVLIILTFTTVFVAELDLGPWNVFVALAIAAIKATLVILFFMHVMESSSLTKLFVVAGLMWLGLLFGLTFNDYMSRTWSALGKWW